MSSLENLSWDFPISEMSGFVSQNMALIMPLLGLIIGVLLALLVVDGLTLSMLKVIGFVAGMHTSGIDDQHHIGLGTTDDEPEPD
jgi:fumarate reductase subunit D